MPSLYKGREPGSVQFGPPLIFALTQGSPMAFLLPFKGLLLQVAKGIFRRFDESFREPRQEPEVKPGGPVDLEAARRGLLQLFFFSLVLLASLPALPWAPWSSLKTPSNELCF